MLGGALWAQAPASPAKPPRPAAAQPGQPAAAQPATPAAPAAPVIPDNKVVLTLGAHHFTKAQFDLLMNNMSAEARGRLGGNTPEVRRKLAEQMAEIITYADQARKLALQDKPSNQMVLMLQQEQAMASLLYQHIQETSKPGAAEAAAYYEQHKDDYLAVKARHILVRFKGSRVPLKPGQAELSDAEALAKAQQLHDRIVKGEDFATVAKAESDDTTSGAEGGDLGQFGRGQMVQVFEQAAFSQKVGEVSQPVKSPFGYHLILVQERSPKPLAEVEADVMRKLTSEATQKAMEAVRQASKPELDSAYFGAPAPAAPPAAVAPAAKAPVQK